MTVRKEQGLEKKKEKKKQKQKKERKKKEEKGQVSCSCLKFIVSFVCLLSEVYNKSICGLSYLMGGWCKGLESSFYPSGLGF